MKVVFLVIAFFLALSSGGSATAQQTPDVESVSFFGDSGLYVVSTMSVEGSGYTTEQMLESDAFIESYFKGASALEYDERTRTDDVAEVEESVATRTFDVVLDLDGDPTDVIVVFVGNNTNIFAAIFAPTGPEDAAFDVIEEYLNSCLKDNELSDVPDETTEFDRT